MEDFLNVSRLETGRLLVKQETLSIKPIINQVREQISANYPAHKFQIDIPDNFPKVLADTERLTQVFYNLMDNAGKYSPKGGVVIVSAHLDDNDTQAIITVADNGMGIPVEELPKLFTRFHRVYRPEASSIRGTSLGLYIVKSILEMMGGKI